MEANVAKKLSTTKTTKQSGQFKSVPKEPRSGTGWTVHKEGKDVFYVRLDGEIVKMPEPAKSSSIVRGGSIFPSPKPAKS